jgi:hypothetical protein
MSARAFESFLARIYVDAGARARFKENPRAEAERAGLSDAECTALESCPQTANETAEGFSSFRQALAASLLH